MTVLSSIRMQCFTLLVVAILLSHITPAHSAIECYQCHGSSNPPDYRPKDAPYRNITTGGFQGNHRTHMGPGANTTACTACHPNNGYTSSHRNSRIDLTANINGSPLAAVYRNGSSGFSQTPTPQLGSCSNVNCHFEQPTPTWGSAQLSAPGDCGVCHGAPPSGGDSGAAGSHATHDRYRPGTGGCATCHSDHLGEQSPFAHATSAGRRNLVVTIRNPGNSAAGSYNGPVNDYLPKSQNNQFGKCSALYCHSNGTAVATGSLLGNFSSPTWGSGQISCSGCHASPPDYASGSPKANAHPKHNYYNYSCSRCHFNTTVDGTSITDPAVHANAAYDVAAPPGETLSYTASPTGGNCTTYCHSSAQGITDPTQPPTYASPSWNQQYGRGCQNCHAAGYHSLGFVAYMKSGSHEKHLQFEVGGGCGTCHFKPEYNDQPTCWQCHVVSVFYGHQNNSARGPEHADGKIDVALNPNFPATGATGSYNGDTVPGTPYGTCLNLYCHSRGTRLNPPFEPPNSDNIRWGETLPSDCTGCHGGDGNSASPLATGSHASHLGYDCNGCHQATVIDNRTAIPAKSMAYYPIYTDKSKHANGSVEVALSPNNGGIYFSGAKSPGSAALGCSNTYCHTNGASVATGSISGTVNSPVWGGSPPLTCSGCHGYPPAYPDTTPKANNHARHTQFGCQACHFATTTNGTSIADQSRHINKQYDLTAGDGVSFTYTYGTGGGSCATVSCHGTGSAPRGWAETGCGNCHTAPPDTPSHRKHFTGAARYAVYGSQSSSQLIGFNCGSCHPLDETRDNDGSVTIELYNPAAPAGSLKALNPETATFANGTTLHQDGRGIGYTNGTCSNVYCHSDGTIISTSQPAVSPPVTWNGASLTCGSCHGNPPAYSNGAPKVNGHPTHAGRNCAVCHAGTTADGLTIADQRRHLNGAYDLLPGAGNGFTYAFAPVGSSCSSISCHHDGTAVATGTPVVTQPASYWGGSMTCSSCHGNPPAYAKGSPKSNAHPKHARYGCDICHYSVTTDGSTISGRTLHGNGEYTVTPSPTTAFSYTFATAGGSCIQTYCHSDGTTVATGQTPSNGYWPIPWSGSVTFCDPCHSYYQGGPQYASGAPKANSHPQHWGGAGCSSCHYGVTTDGSTIANQQLHINRQYDIAFPPGAAFDFTVTPGATSCSNVSCHHDGTRKVTGTAVVSAATATWGIPMSCNACHGNPPAYVNGVPKKNSHQGNHAAYGCQVCHYGVTTTGTTVTNANAHHNTLYDVTPAAGYSFSYGYAASGGSCSNVSCHSDGTSVRTGTSRSSGSATWGGPALTCTGCHGSPPSYSNGSPKANNHAKHAAFGCQACHSTVTSDGTTVTDPTKHRNNQYDVVAGPGTAFDYAYGTSYSTCSTISCHQDGTVVATGTTRSTSTSFWGNAGSCTMCHAGPPWYDNGTIKANSHQRHWYLGYSCQQCHYSVTTNGSTITTPARHMNNQYDVSPATGVRTFTYSYAGSGGTCSANYCHSDGTSVKTGLPPTGTATWGEPAKNCGSCHGFPPDYVSGTPKANRHVGAHAVYGCQQCHYGTTYNGTVVSGIYSHANGSYDVSGPSSMPVSYSTYQGQNTCYSTYCHSDGTGLITGGSSTRTPYPSWNNATVLTCSSCHGNPPLYADRSPKANLHDRHSGYGCHYCHATVTIDGGTISDRARHANGAYDVFNNLSSSFTYTYRAGGSSCSNVSCHTSAPQNCNWSLKAQAPLSFSPGSGSTGVPVDTEVSVTFNEEMDPATINATSFQLQTGSTTVPGTVSYDGANRKAIFTPSAPLDYYNSYTATLASTVANAQGGPLPAQYSFGFTTAKSAQFTTLLNATFENLSLSTMTSYAPSGGWSWSSIYPGYNGTALPYTSQGYASVNESSKIDAQLLTPALNLSAYQSAELQFSYNCKLTSPSVADVDISLNGSAGPWTTVWRKTPMYANYTDMGWATINLSALAKGGANVMLRFRFTPQTPSNAGWWAIDNVVFGGDPR